jgi:hypothetical protein
MAIVTLRLQQIRALGPDQYELTFQGEDGSSELVVCRVFQHRGITGVRYDPDVFVTGRGNAREVTAAVLHYHRERGPLEDGGRTGGPTLHQ